MKMSDESNARRSESLKEYFRNRPKVELVKNETIEHIVIKITYPPPIVPDPMPEDGIETISSMRIKSAQNNIRHTKQKRVVLFGVINTKH